MCAPHPEVFTTTVSTPAASKTSIVCRAIARAREHGEQGLPGRQCPRQRAHETAATDESLQTGDLIEAQPGRGRAEQAWVAQEQAEVRPAKHPAQQATWPDPLH